MGERQLVLMGESSLFEVMGAFCLGGPPAEGSSRRDSGVRHIRTEWDKLLAG